MSLKCPSCHNNFRFSQLLFLRLGMHNLRCDNCSKVFNINAFADYLIEMLIIIICSTLVITIIMILGKIISNGILKTAMMIVLMLLWIVLVSYGRAYLLVRWITKRRT